MQSANREANDSARIWRRMLRGAAVLGLVIFTTGPLGCGQCSGSGPEYDEDATKEEKPKYEW